MRNSTLWQITYSNLLLPTLLLGAKFSALKNQKTRATLAGQEGLWERLEQQVTNRDPSKPLLWFHVASAGEYLQAMPVMERFMAAGFQCALTVTSITGYNWAQKRRAQYPDLVVADFIPLDTKPNIKRLIKLFQPRALVLVKFDLWPNAIWESKKQNIPIYLISATLHMKSKRVTSRLGRSLYQSLYANIDGIFTVSEDDKLRFLETCPEHQHVINVGDTRFDSVLDRRRQVVAPDLPRFIKEKTVFLVGSSWPADEEHINGPLIKALKTYKNLFLIIAPHETDEPHLIAIEKAFSDFAVKRFTEISGESNEPFDVLVINTVGHLSALYTYADLAYVGGAFGKGVHNVMEPSAMGTPTIVGPFYQNSPEAMDLIENGKCFSIRTEEDFSVLLNRFLQDDALREKVGAEACNYIEQQAGASDKCFEFIKEGIA
ncbi:MAG: 3-deoxy-D-manno-octulosonic acid transferase [Gammaproteobacteria bacterium]|nr:3-deoxy-D-manno-octulosonic acid transferase [Gammaproteobacteria bacterium]